MKVIKHEDNGKLPPKLRNRKLFYNLLSFILKLQSIIFMSAVGGRSSVTSSSKIKTKVTLQIVTTRKQVKTILPPYLKAIILPCVLSKRNSKSRETTKGEFSNM